MRRRDVARGVRPALLGPILIVSLLGAAGAGVPARRIDSDRDPGVISFPRALGAHPDAALEWWYVTAILRDDDGRTLGAQWTLFRVRLDRLGGGAPAADGAPPARDAGDAPSAWRPGDLYFAHVAVGDSASRSFGVAERVGRTGVALAGADTADLDVRIRDWFLRRGSDGRFRLRGANDERTLELTLTPSRARPVAWGPAFRSAKSPDPRYFSRYQTDPWMRAEGTISLGSGSGRPVRGTAWFDHEWSDGAFDSAVVGWDWLGARLGDGRAVMLYRLRDARGGTRHFFGGIVGRDGRVTPVGPGRTRWSPLREWRSPRTGARYPVAWRVLLEPPGAPPLTLDFGAAFDAQELVTDKSTRVTYWEGMVFGTAEEEGARTPLEGYLELTGYAGGGVPGRISSGEPSGR